MSINNAKVRLKVLETHGCEWVMIDLLKMFDKEENGKQEDNIYYALLVKKLKARIRNSIENQLQENQPVKQIDLEDSIKEINEEQNAKK